MTELSVTVRVNETEPATYRFEQFPVLVGRSPDCHLSICHESMPRELFFAWLEHNGDAVRVETVPTVTMPVTANGRALRGGCSGRRIALTAGEVEILLSIGSRDKMGAAPDNGNRPVIKRLRMLGGAILAVVGLAFVLSPRPGAPDAEQGPEIPPQLVLSAPASGAARNPHGAKMQIQEADERLGRRTDVVPNRMRAAELLDSAAVTLSASSPGQSAALRARAAKLKQELRAEYRLRRRLWLDAVRCNNPDERASAARKLLPWLEAMQSPAFDAMSVIALRSQKEKHR